MPPQSACHIVLRIMLQIIANLLLNWGRRSNPLFITEISVKCLTWPNTWHSDRVKCFAMLQLTFCLSTIHATHWSIYVKENRRRMVSIYALCLVGHVFRSWLTDRMCFCVVVPKVRYVNKAPWQWYTHKLCLTSFIQYSVWRQVQSLLQNNSST